LTLHHAINPIYTLTLHYALTICYRNAKGAIGELFFEVIRQSLCGFSNSVFIDAIGADAHQPTESTRTKLKVFIKGIEQFCFLFRSEEHTSELQSRENLVCRLLLE